MYLVLVLVDALVFVLVFLYLLMCLFWYFSRYWIMSLSTNFFEAVKPP